MVRLSNKGDIMTNEDENLDQLKRDLKILSLTIQNSEYICNCCGNNFSLNKFLIPISCPHCKIEFISPKDYEKFPKKELK